MSDCTHQNFHTAAEINRLQEENETEPHAYVVELTIKCLDCGQPFYFQGLPCFVYDGRPSTSALGDKARLPITPHIFTQQEKKKPCGCMPFESCRTCYPQGFQVVFCKAVSPDGARCGRQCYDSTERCFEHRLAA